MRNEYVNLANMLRERQDKWLKEEILTKVQIEDLTILGTLPFQFKQPYLFMSVV